MGAGFQRVGLSTFDAPDYLDTSKARADYMAVSLEEVDPV